MIPFDIETGASAPGVISPTSRRTAPGRRWGLKAAVLLVWALVLGATEAGGPGQGPIGRGENPWIQRRGMANKMPTTTASMVSDDNTRCKCPTVNFWKCDEETKNVTNCTCGYGYLFRVLEDGEHEIVNGDLCKSISESCRFDCDSFHLFCTDGFCSCESGDGRSTCGDDMRLQFMTAAQIALGSALMVAVMALAVLVWKMCYRPGGDSRWSAFRRRGGQLLGRSHSESRDRVGSADDGSTNSIQNFVIQKMRDRPPRYEDAPPEMPPCYDDIIGAVSPSAPSPTAHPTSASWWSSRRMAEAAPPYEARDDGGVGGHLRNASAQASATDANNDTPEISVSIITDSQCSLPSTSASNTLSDDGPEGIENPAYVREIYVQHL